VLERNKGEDSKYHLTELRLFGISIMFFVVQRAGFEPANPYGKGYPIGRSSQSVDLESFTFDLAWLPLHTS
jgi:hypothetical protein